MCSFPSFLLRILFFLGTPDHGQKDEITNDPGTERAKCQQSIINRQQPITTMNEQITTRVKRCLIDPLLERLSTVSPCQSRRRLFSSWDGEFTLSEKSRKEKPIHCSFFFVRTHPLLTFARTEQPNNNKRIPLLLHRQQQRSKQHQQATKASNLNDNKSNNNKKNNNKTSKKEKLHRHY
ncbi:MAG: hypothetical protein J3R72DRAFT_196681 [Linnemannia gamsii]|nr:MAG: hypothetical protein J3R72DRAFT_196681 [Linnemannia gamsii]